MKHILIFAAMTTLAGCSGDAPSITVSDLDLVPVSTAVHPDYFPVKRCVNIGNALEAENEGDWGYTIRRAELEAVAAAGFDTIRLPVRWDLKSGDRPPYRIEPALLARVDEIIDWAQDLGLRVVLDVHHYRSLSTDMARERPKFLALWAQIARHYKDAPVGLEPGALYFELFNEPTADADMDMTNRLYAEALRIIRQTNPTRAVMMGGNRWNSVDTLGDVDWPRDPYIVATFHDYGPHDFTHQGNNWEDSPPPVGRRWRGADDLSEFKDSYVQARAFQAKTGLPVFVGEFGVIDTVPLRQRVAWTKARRQAMEQSGFSWCAWDMVARFAVYDKDDGRWLPGMRDALLGE